MVIGSGMNIIMSHCQHLIDFMRHCLFAGRTILGREQPGAGGKVLKQSTYTVPGRKPGAIFEFSVLQSLVTWSRWHFALTEIDGKLLMSVENYLLISDLN